MNKLSIKAMKNGPVIVRSEEFDETGAAREYSVALCRCGKSATKPLCDGAHVKAEFQAPDSVVYED